MTRWSPQQDSALSAVRDWLQDPRGRPWFYLAGYAGTGKSTLARHLAEGVDGDVCYGAFTGKAALVMKSKGCQGATTIHSMIYRLEAEGWGGEPRFVLNEDASVRDAALVIIDEVSMVDEDLARDLLSFRTPILVLGDPAQLPPVRGTGFFTARDPDFMLTEVHRQARDNPIIELSMRVREGGGIERGAYGDCKVINAADVDRDDVLAADQVLVGRNITRRLYNGRIRTLRSYSGDIPQQGERLISLRNNKRTKLLNGQIWHVQGAEMQRKALGKKRKRTVTSDIAVSLELEDPDTGQRVETVARIEDFQPDGADHIPWQEMRGFDRFDFGYAITVHKSQGSQWPSVYLFDESRAFGDDRARHLYTGLTRAAERVTVVI